MLFSEVIEGKPEEQRRRLYSLFTRAVKAGELPALKLLDKLTVTGVKGEPLSRADFIFPGSAEPQIRAWTERHEAKSSTRQGLTRSEAERLTDQQLTALIAKQTAPKKTRKPRAKKSAPQAAV